MLSRDFDGLVEWLKWYSITWSSNSSTIKKKKDRTLSQPLWLTIIILATQRAEIRRIEVWSQPGQIVLRDPIYLEKNPSQKRTGRVTQGVDPEFKPQYCKKKELTPAHIMSYFTFYFYQYVNSHPIGGSPWYKRGRVETSASHFHPRCHFRGH
jgi:hypothetical protein